MSSQTHQSEESTGGRRPSFLRLQIPPSPVSARTWCRAGFYGGSVRPSVLTFHHWLCQSRRGGDTKVRSVPEWCDEVAPASGGLPILAGERTRNERPLSAGICDRRTSDEGGRGMGDSARANEWR